MDFFSRIGMIIIVFTLVAGVKFLSEITNSVDKLNSRLADIVERIEAHDNKIKLIETFIFDQEKNYDEIP